ncbi:MAG: hypothetical protein ACOH2M_25955, partial [Cypionkella sp.]
ARFRFWEIILVAAADEVDPFLRLVKLVPNIRLIKVRHGTEFYRRRVIAAAEAIGDVVVLTTAAELPRIDLLKLVDTVHSQACVVVGQMQTVPMLDRLIATPLVALGRWAGFNVGMRDMQTVGFPRTLLNQVLAHPAKELALRFLPRDVGLPQANQMALNAAPTLRSFQNLERRLGLAQKLLVNLAPRLLQVVTLISSLTSLMAMGFGIYVIGVWWLLPTVAPGWLTLSAMLSVTGFMLGCTTSALCMGMLFLISRAEQDDFSDVSGEVNRVDLFGMVASDLNVEVVTETSAKVPV